MTTDPGRANLTTARAFVDELARRGLTHVVIAPGSRSTPLAVAFAAHPGIRVWMHVDERSAAYFTLGMARALAAPVALLCTSGTAAANFLPAVVEAHYSRVPLLVLTADRPPELRGWGAAQTIDQIRLFGGHAKWFIDMPVPDGNPGLLRQARAVAARAMQTAAASPAGPVHLNFPFREPLLPADLDAAGLGTAGDAGVAPTEPVVGATQASRLSQAAGPPSIMDAPVQSGPTSCQLDDLTVIIENHERGIIVCGPGECPGLPERAAALSAASGYPILADPLSALRFGPHDRSRIIDAHDAFLRDAETAQRLSPDVILRTGGLPASKPLQLFLAACPERPHILIDPGDPRDPFHLATRHIRANPAATFAALADHLGTSETRSRTSWPRAWAQANAATRQVIHSSTAEMEEFFEGRVAAELADCLPDGATLVVGNSMPVRDVDTFVGGDCRRLRIVGNRGASGIDGLVSSALGAAAVSSGPVALLVGDLSFSHDMNGLLAAKLHGLDTTIVVLNNDGGGIFSFLPQADLLDHATFERLFGTPTGLDFRHAAALYGASFARPANWDAFRKDVSQAIAVPGLSIVEVVTGRERNVALHRQVWTAVSEALRSTTVGV